MKRYNLGNHLKKQLKKETRVNAPGSETASYLSETAEDICRKRYYQKDDDGNPIEDWPGLVSRVVNHVCKDEDKEFKDQIHQLMLKTKFLPNSPCLVNAGTKSKSSGLAACFIAKAPEDTWLSMTENIANFGHIARQGGGAGVSLSNIRPEGDPVFGSTHAKACGPIEHMRMISEVMSSITQAGFRSMAIIIVLRIDHPDIIKFIKCKQNDRALKALLKDDFFGHYDQIVNNVDGQLRIVLDKFIHNVNISVLVTDDFMKKAENNKDFDLVFNGKVYKTVKARDLLEMIAQNAWQNGDPGILFYDTLNSSPYKYSQQEITACNPCITGDTLVAVADGRDSISIATLAKEGKDVPVFCTNNNKQLTVRMMRNPRATGRKKVLKITLENNHTLRTTKDHKFILHDGTLKEAKDLRSGDRLSVMNRMSAPLEVVIKKKQKSANHNHYYWINCTTHRGWKLEHRLIYKFYDRTLTWNDSIHHRDRNGLNNEIANLEKMTKLEHDNLHKADKMGDNNPMRRAKTEWSKEKWNKYRENMSNATSGTKNGHYKRVSNKVLLKHAVRLTKEKGRRLSYGEWQSYAKQNNLVCVLTKFRKKEFGSLIAFLDRAAHIAKVYREGLSGSALTQYKRFMEIKNETDLDLFFSDGRILVHKICENCKKEFIVDFQRREISFCSSLCVIRYRYSVERDATVAKIKNSQAMAREKKQIHQISAFNLLKSKLGREPLEKEFSQHCKKIGLPFRIPRKKEVREKILIGTFQSWKQLKEEAQTYNHKIISIDEDGSDYVYNGTVDEYHNFFIGHFKEQINNFESFVYVNCRQCGEIGGPDLTACQLASIDVSKFYDEEKNDLDWPNFKKAVHACVRFLDDIIDVNTFPTKEFKTWAKENRPIGLGIMGFADLLLKMKVAYGKRTSLEIAERISKFMSQESHRVSKLLGKEKGTPKNCRYDELQYRRNITTLSYAPTGTISQLANCSSGIEPIFSPLTIRQDNTGKRELIHEDANKPYFRCAIDPEKGGEKEVHWKEHVAIQGAFQKHVNNAISKTINFSNSATTEDVKQAFMLAWKSKVKGITIYRDGSKSAQVLTAKDKHAIQSFHAKKRPKKVKADIFRTSAQGLDWHLIVGSVDGNPYELFAVNGESNLPERGIVIKQKKRHYSLYDENENLLIDNLSKQERNIDINIDKETRRFSLELRHGIHPKFIVEQIDKSNEVVTSFCKAVSRVFSTKYISTDDLISIAEDIACPDCAAQGKATQLIPAGGCWQCPETSCSYSRCG